MNIGFLRVSVVLLFTSLLFSVGCNIDQNKKGLELSQPNTELQIIDISQQQLSLYNQYIESDSAERTKVFRDSLFFPYKEIWDGLIQGRIEIFDRLVDYYGIRRIEELNEKNKKFYTRDKDESLLNAFNEIRVGIKEFTGFSPRGKWYLFYGPSWANLGGVGNGVMFIDFAYPDNKDLNSVINWFPHELNHQIYSNVNRDSSRNVLSRCIDEGFATYVNKLYWNNVKGKKNYSLAMSLSYTEEELTSTKEHWNFVLDYFRDHYLSEDQDEIDKFGGANRKLKEGLPGKIGYLIGYRIVEHYVEIHGSDSWRDIYKMNRKELLEKSKIFEVGG